MKLKYKEAACTEACDQSDNLYSSRYIQQQAENSMSLVQLYNKKSKREDYGNMFVCDKNVICVIPMTGQLQNIVNKLSQEARKVN